MKCLIIAAGRGSRLADRSDSKPLTEVEGIPLIERIIHSVMAVGINDFLIVIGYNGEKIRKRLTQFVENNDVKIEFIQNDQWQKPNGVSVYCGRHMLKKPFLLLMSDHIFDPEIVRMLLDEGVGSNCVKLAVDTRIQNNPLVDIDDVTKVMVKSAKIHDIGKSIQSYNAFDTGIFLCTPEIFAALEESFSSGDETLSGGMLKLAERKRAGVMDIGNHYWLDIDDDNALEKAQQILALN